MRTRRGIASHTGPSAGTGPDGDRNSAGPRSRGPGPGARRRGPCSRQRQRQARASHATRTRPSRPSREHKPRFFHPRRYLPPPSLPPLLRLPLLLLHLLVPPFSRSFSCFRLFFSRLRCYRDGSRSLAVTSHFCLFFLFLLSFLADFAIFYWKM